jgi:salicylate hydroxylase
VVSGALVAACDGVRSAVRGSTLGDPSLRFTGEVAWRGLARREDLGAGAISNAAVVWTGPGRHVVHYPLRGGALVNFIAVVRDPDFRVESWTQNGRRETLLQQFQGWPESVDAVIRAAPSVSRWALVDRAPLRSWRAPGVVLLGDAAHPMLPFLAQGAAMAIEDAVVLAGCLGRTPGGPQAAAARYERLRKPRTSKVRAWSRRNGVLFHLPDLAARAAFGAADAVGSLKGPDAGVRRLDWLYGYDAHAIVCEPAALAQPLAKDYILSQSPRPDRSGPLGPGVTS